MTNDNGLHCRICGRISGNLRTCKQCSYLMKNGGSEETIKRTYSNDAVKKIWQENKEIANALADTYYDSVLENYGKSCKGWQQRNFGYNTFADGANMMLDIIMPLLDDDSQHKIKAKVDSMIAARRRHNVGK